MKTTLQFRNVTIHNSWYGMLEQHIDHWQRLTAVSATEVVIERQFEGRMAFRFRVRAVLQVSGPDLQAEANGRTFKEALLAVTQDLERQIQDRHARRRERFGSERQLSATSSPQIQA